MEASARIGLSDWAKDSSATTEPPDCSCYAGHLKAKESHANLRTRLLGGDERNGAGKGGRRELAEPRRVCDRAGDGEQRKVACKTVCEGDRIFFCLLQLRR